MSGSVWIIEAGEYSDYGVTAVCPDEATARAVCDRLNEVEGHGDPYTYSERPLLAEPPNRVTCWAATDEGLVNRYDSYWDFDAPSDGQEMYRGSWHRSEEAARKAAQDHAARRAAIEAGQALP